LFSATSIGNLANAHGLELTHVEPQVTHGGSMRYFISHMNAHKVTDSVRIQLKQERANGIGDIGTYKRFSKNVDKVKRDLMDLLNDIKSKGQNIVGYGATSKSTTVTNYFGISASHVDFICDTTPTKQFKYTPGVHIPVLPHSEFLQAEKDFVLLFAWNHAKEIMQKEKEHMAQTKTKWIMYVPNVQVISP